MHSAITPTPKLEDDFYDWWERHEQKVRLVQAQPDASLVFIGDSITHLFELDELNGTRGKRPWDRSFAKYRPINLGFGWDRTQNVLWRLANGEFTGLRPRAVVLLIGTNNLTGSANAPTNSPAEIVAGITAIHAHIRAASPTTSLLLMGLLPRSGPADPLRARIAEVNAMLAAYAATHADVTLVDIGPLFLAADGTIPKHLMQDGVHPTEAGYTLWADAIAPHIHRLHS